MGKSKATPMLVCKRCGSLIDQRSIDWFAEHRHLQKRLNMTKRNYPSVCGACLTSAVWGLLDEVKEDGDGYDAG